jgi:hypothetical protein
MNRAQRRAAERGVDPKEAEHQQLQKIAAHGTPQDVTDPRAKSQRHRKSTADKWNQ